MHLHCLGTAGYHPNATRHTSCYLVPQAGIVLDAGTGFFRLPPLLQTDSIDVLLSHSHLDHVFGLSFILDVVHQRPLKETRVWGTARKLNAVRSLLFHPDLFPVEPPLHYAELDPFESIDQGDGPWPSAELRDGSRLSWCPLEHPGGCTGYRIDWPDRSIAYITDTTAHRRAAYLSLIHGVDLLVHEANFVAGQESFASKTGHSVTEEVARIAAMADVGQLLLTHVNPLADEPDPFDVAAALEIFPSTHAAHDGMIVEF
jgi:ribonuclease Z